MGFIWIYGDTIDGHEICGYFTSKNRLVFCVFVFSPGVMTPITGQGIHQSETQQE
jgi:hypothetical protein